MEAELAAIKVFAEIGMTGLVAWIVWWTFRKTFPSMLDTFKGQLAEERKQCVRCSEAMERLTGLIIRIYERVVEPGSIEHDMDECAVRDQCKRREEREGKE